MLSYNYCFLLFFIFLIEIYREVYNELFVLPITL